MGTPFTSYYYLSSLPFFFSSLHLSTANRHDSWQSSSLRLPIIPNRNHTILLPPLSKKRITRSIVTSLKVERRFRGGASGLGFVVVCSVGWRGPWWIRCFCDGF
ncbi:hypothetical protein JHK82_013496 [Glycine max]|uniref:Uncharacterized protein n=2 Tax=Glycine subgen. Soja TaxID=1462606 RepID=A0A0R0K506_SOYBN|nr:hypothetical protein JHK85_013865 [Glycine max]KAG5155527.1 hypothetical protein JHK82_013496 [Glycine max]KAH1135413.1 hypothetical protein GYH30_013252 [Glycine max]KRH59765.1 hypothetical protein GLYMA_05G201600v4 [Glycine max]RZC13395.1 hypothetical protein D0Y65_012849 [Glycine soja]